MIVCAGEALVDLVPEPRCGGGPMNVAVTAARLGAPAAFVGRVSTDELGDLLWEHLRASGVRLDAAERGPEPTARAVVEHVPTPRFRFEGDDTADTMLAAADLTPLGPGPHLLHGGTLGLFRGITAPTLADLVERTDALVSLDPNVRPQIIDDRGAWFAFFERWVARASIVKVSSEDLGWIWPGDSDEATAARLFDRGVGAVIVTRGEAGAVAHRPGGSVAVDAPLVEVVDTVGAGDAFCGGLLAHLWRDGVTDRLALDGLDDDGWRAALTAAVSVAARTCTRAGADPPWADELARGQGGRPVHVLFATSELSPVASVGGLAVAAAGLVRALRDEGVDVTVALPDYGDIPLVEKESLSLDVPAWAGPAMARRGTVAGVGPLTLVRAHGSARPHPYNQADGTGWPDNDRRFFAFSAAVAALTAIEQPDVLHLNDWHTSAVLAFGWPLPPTVLTIHNLAYQGWADPEWLLAFPHYREAFVQDGGCNPLVGGIRLADAVVAVSPTYAREILTEAEGMGIEDELQAREGSLVGILNGIDTAVWDPAADPRLPATYSWPDLAGKAVCRTAALERMGLPELGPASGGPLITVVSRLVQQKGVDLLLPLVGLLDRLPAQLAILGDGDHELASALEAASAAAPERMAFWRGYDEGLSHLLFGGGDLLAMPSRFEPCGLAQMQAMRYGTLPMVTDVGGLHDTVLDIDDHPGEGTGLVAREPSTLALLDALHRGVRAHGTTTRRHAMQRRGMAADWSWVVPARQHIELYDQLIGGSAPWTP